MCFSFNHMAWSPGIWMEILFLAIHQVKNKFSLSPLCSSKHHPPQAPAIKARVADRGPFRQPKHLLWRPCHKPPNSRWNSPAFQVFMKSSEPSPRKGSMVLYLQKTKRFIYFYFMYMTVFHHVCLCAAWVQPLEGPEGGIRCPQNESYKQLWAAGQGCWEVNKGPQQEGALNSGPISPALSVYF